MADFYVLNPTRQTLHAALSLEDFRLQRTHAIPPGHQGHLSLSGKEVEAAKDFYARYGFELAESPAKDVPVVEIEAKPHVPEKTK